MKLKLNKGLILRWIGTFVLTVKSRRLSSMLFAFLFMTVIQSVVFAEEHVDDYSWIRGTNYVPSYARNDVQIWMDYDSKIIDRELGIAARLKLNSVRIFLQYAVYKHDPKLFLERYENFLSLCKKHNIRAMVVVFDSCFGDFPVLENYQDKDWMANPGQNMIGPEHWDELEKYVQDVVGAYRNDERIVMWDVMNEPYCTKYANNEKDRKKISTFLDHFIDVVKQNDPTHPCTVGFMFSRFIPDVVDKIDILGWHNYTGDMDALRADIHYVKELGQKHGKPIHISEIARRDSNQHFSKFMPVLREEKIGWYFWELMLGKTQFSRGPNPIQGVITTDGKSFDPKEISAILDVDVEKSSTLFPKRPPVKMVLKDGIMTYKGAWTRWSGDGPRDGYLFYANDADSLAELTFTSKTEVSVAHKVGRDCGIAEVWLDGNFIKEIDTYSPTDDWYRATVLVSGLDKTDAPRTIEIKVTGRKNSKSTNSYVQIVGLDDRWSAERANLWYAKQPWLAGFNYVPSTACNTTEWWQEETFDLETIDRELGWASDLGLKTARCFTQYIVWKDDPKGFKKRFEQFLSIADKHGITIMPVLFDDCAFGTPRQLDPFLGMQREPIPGMILSSWTPSPGKKLGFDLEERPLLKRYVKDMLSSFGSDKRVVIWDLYNEPMNAVRVGTPDFLREIFLWAREAAPSQPLTISVWGDHATNPVMLGYSDVVSFHCYTNFDGLKNWIERLKKHGRPMVNTEWMARPTGSSIETDLPLFREEGVGCYMWGLVNGRTQCQFPWWNKPNDPIHEAGWFHDIFHKDGTVYRPKEIEVIKREILKAKQSRVDFTVVPEILFRDAGFASKDFPIWIDTSAEVAHAGMKSIGLNYDCYRR